MQGEYTFSKNALKAYEDWYLGQEEGFVGRGCPLGPMFDGYWARRPTHVKKMGMALSASRGSSFIVEEDDFKRALGILEQTEKRMPKVFAGIGRSRYAEDTDAILSYIKRKGVVTKEQLMRDFYRDVDSTALEAVVKVLMDMKIIEVVRNTESRETLYKAI